MIRIALAAACAIAPLSATFAADLCKAVALRDVPAIESPRSIIPKGGFDDSITGYNVEKDGGDAEFCSHGGYCYPTHLHVGNQTVEALRLVNCTVDKSHPYDEGTKIGYELVVNRATVPAAQLRRDDLDNRFLQMGLCSACADNVAQFYVSRPQSQCSILARRALEGDPVATKQLQEAPPYCTWHYK